MFVADGARAAESASFFDAEREDHCTPELTQDGATRCMPVRGSTSTFYRDAQCGLTVRVASFYATCDTPLPAEPVLVEREPPFVACGRPVAKAYEVAAERASGTLYDRVDGVCTPHVWDRERERFYEIGPQIPPDRFMRVGETVE
jgi:hypothetical protein